MSTTRTDELHHDRYHNMKAAMCAAGATAVLLALAAPAKAEIATLTYETNLYEVPAAGWPAGVTLSGTLVYDTEAIPEQLNANQARYHAISYMIQLSKDDVSATFVSFDPIPIDVFNDSFATVYVDDIRIGGGGMDGTFLGFEIRSFGVSFHAESSTPLNILTSTELPTEKATLDAFPINSTYGAVYFKDMEGTAYANAPVLSSFSLTLEAEYVLSCEGFYEPFDSAVSLSRKSRRLIPLRMSLFDQDGLEVGPDGVTPPVVSVTRSGAIGGGELDELVESAGRATEGNSFVWDETDSLWMFNISTKPFSATGTYTVSVDAGDDSYLVDPTCVGTFVRQ